MIWKKSCLLIKVREYQKNGLNSLGMVVLLKINMQNGNFYELFKVLKEN